MPTGKFREQLSRLAFEMQKSYFSALFSEYLLSQLSLLQVSLLNKTQHFFFATTPLSGWTQLECLENIPIFPVLEQHGG